MIDILVWFAIIIIALGLISYLLQQFPLPPPLNKFATIAIVVVATIVIIILLLQLTGTGPPLRLPR